MVTHKRFCLSAKTYSNYAYFFMFQTGTADRNRNRLFLGSFFLGLTTFVSPPRDSSRPPAHAPRTFLPLHAHPAAQTSALPTLHSSNLSASVAHRRRQSDSRR